MITFFRKIRQQFLTEKRYSKYLLYAVGEILLVVIGILLALAINNRNQDRITREKEQTYLIGLRNEFQTNKLKLQELMEVNTRNYRGAVELLEYISMENQDPVENQVPGEKQLSELLYNTFAFDIAFNANNSLLLEMISSGSLKDLSNGRLRILLTNWISILDDVARQEDDLGLQREKVLDLFRTEAYSLRTILDQTEGLSKELGLEKAKTNASNLSLLRSQEFENNVISFMLSSHSTQTAHYAPLMEELNAILELIQAEIIN